MLNVVSSVNNTNTDVAKRYDLSEKAIVSLTYVMRSTLSVMHLILAYLENEECGKNKFTCAILKGWENWAFVYRSNLSIL